VARVSDQIPNREVAAHVAHFWTLLQVGDDEILLSDSVRVAEQIRMSGGSVELKVWDEMWHTWPMYVGLPEADGALAEIGEFLERVSSRPLYPGQPIDATC
jgi:acetyl esterase/lipase